LGLNPLALQMLANSTVFNPHITQAQNISKQQLLAMLYAQYKSYDLLQDAYLDPSFKEEKLLTQVELLHSIKQSMEAIGIQDSVIQERMNQYQNFKKGDLELIEQELQELGAQYKDLNMSEDEKRIALLSRNELLKEANKYLSKFKISDEEKRDSIEELKKENVNFIRSYLIDLIDSFKKNETKPPLFSTKESMLLKSPKIISDIVYPHAMNYIKSDWQHNQKSKAYQYWKEQAFNKKIGEKQENLIEEHTQKSYEKASLFKSLFHYH
jgi:hypothetical protein